MTRYLDDLRRRGIVHNFAGHLAGMPYEPLDSTFTVASLIAEAFRRHRNLG
ncbi:MAG: hypothetical protein ACHQAQ_04310 [Hyphomicrobiales bacterium]